MKVLLTKDVRIKHKAGEIVEVTPEEYFFLTSVKAAVNAAKTEPKKGKKK